MDKEEAIVHISSLVFVSGNSYDKEAWQTLKASVLAQQTNNSAMDKIAGTLSCLCEKWGDYSDPERQALIVTCCQQLRQ